MKHSLLTLLIAFSFVTVSNMVDAQDEDERPDVGLLPPVSFEREVLPLLEKRCNKCHHADESQGGLDLTRVETIRRGGDELGAAIVPGKPKIVAV